jgi:hypothetical protein
MGAGPSATLADDMLGELTSNGLYAQLHTGDPGADGTANVSSVTTREELTWGDPSGGSVSITNTPTWEDWAGTSPETEEYVTLWTEATDGDFIDAIELDPSATVETGDDLEMSSLTVSFDLAS